MGVDELMVDRFAALLVDIAARRRGRSMSTIEQISTGRTTRPGIDWLVVLYRSSEVKGNAQLIGYGRYVSQERYAALSSDDLEALAHKIWAGEIDEPPGTDLPDELLAAGEIAWWARCAGWSVDHGPADGLRSTRTLVPDPTLGGDIVVWVRQASPPDADRFTPAAPTRRTICIAVQADCLSVASAESVADSVTRVESDGSESSENHYDLTGTAMLPTSPELRSDGADRRQFVLSVDDVRFLAVAQPDAVPEVTGARVIVRCTLSIAHVNDRYDYGLVDPRGDWIVHAHGATTIRDEHGSAVGIRHQLQLSPLRA